MTRIKLIKNKDPEVLTKEVNEFMSKNKVFASPIIYAKNQFNCFIYYEPSKQLENEKKPFNRNFKNPNAPATEGQKNTLRKRRILFKEDLTMEEAHRLINKR